MKNLRAAFAAPLLPLLCVAVASCGPSAAQKAEMERQRADSIAQAQLEAAEAARLDSLNALKEAARLDSLRVKAAADSAARVELLPKFAVTRNDGAEGIDTYRAKGTPSRHHHTGAYLSATTDNGRRGELRMHVDYCGRDWLELTSALLTVDGETYDLNPDSSPESEVNDDLTCSEWFVCTSGVGQFSDKLANAKSVSIKLMGDKGTKTITLTKPQIESMALTVKLYNLL